MVEIDQMLGKVLVNVPIGPAPLSLSVADYGGAGEKFSSFIALPPRATVVGTSP